jgi:hypothetical protein
MLGGSLPERTWGKKQKEEAWERNKTKMKEKWKMENGKKLELHLMGRW